MSLPSRKPLDRILGNNTEALAFSNGSRLAAWLDKAGVLNWLNLYFQFKPQAINMNVTNDESNTYPVTGTGTDILLPPTGYVKISGFTIGSGSTGNDFVLENGSDLVVPDNGYYDVDGWMNFRHTSNNATVSAVFGVEKASNPGTIIYSPRPTAFNTPNGDRLGLLSGGGSLQLEAGDKLTVWVAADKTGTVICPNATLRIKKYTD